MLGFNSEEDPTLPPKRKKIDKAFIYAVIGVSVAGLGFIVAETYLGHDGFAFYGVVIITSALVINLIKGGIDYRDRKRRKREVEEQGGWAEYVKRHRMELTDDDITALETKDDKPAEGESDSTWQPDSEKSDSEISLKVPMAFRTKTRYDVADPFEHIETITNPSRQKRGQRKKNTGRVASSGYTHKQRLTNGDVSEGDFSSELAPSIDISYVPRKQYSSPSEIGPVDTPLDDSHSGGFASPLKDVKSSQ